MISPIYAYYWLSNVHKQTNVAVHNQCRLKNTFSHWAMSLAWSTPGLDDVPYPWLMVMLPCRYAKATTDACRTWLMLLVICQHRLLEKNIPCFILPDIGRCKCHPTYERMPRIMRAIPWWYCIPLAIVAFQNTDIPCHMSVVLGWWYLSLADVACSKWTSLGLWFLSLANVVVTKTMHKHHGLFMLTLDNIACHYLMLLSKCAQTMLDAWRPWLMIPIVG